MYAENTQAEKRDFLMPVVNAFRSARKQGSKRKDWR